MGGARSEEGAKISGLPDLPKQSAASRIEVGFYFDLAWAEAHRLAPSATARWC
jgi:hypothetical protein